MRVIVPIAAFVAALSCSSAEASVTVGLSIEATLTTTRTTDYTFAPQELWPAQCAGHPFCIITTTELAIVKFPQVWATSQNGVDFAFSQYEPASRVGINGTALYLGNGAYEGVSLEYLGDSGANRIRWYEMGASSQFTVRQFFPTPVPEPTIWAMLIIGFSCIGAAMRHARRSRRLSPTL